MPGVSSRCSSALCVLALLCCVPVSAQAQTVSERIEDFLDREFVLVGLSMGVSLDNRGAGFLAGLEASGGLFESGEWYGLYADVMVDWGEGRLNGQLSFGPEAGILFFGFDLGPVFILGRDGFEMAAKVRLYPFTIGVASVSVGWMVNFSSPQVTNVLLVGLTGKLPAFFE